MTVARSWHQRLAAAALAAAMSIPATAQTYSLEQLLQLPLERLLELPFKPRHVSLSTQAGKTLPKSNVVDRSRHDA